MALRLLERYEEALEAYDACLQIDPDDPHAREGRNQTLIELGQGDDLLAQAERQIRADPNNVEHHISKGDLLREMERYADALKSYNAALKLRPNNPIALGGKAMVLLELGRLDELDGVMSRLKKSALETPDKW
jgi:cytochrome c-type biogenesis protein CcmH/NrfG